MADPDFETELFVAFAEPSDHWGDEGITERLLRTLDRERRFRAVVLTAAVGVGAALATLVGALFAHPLLAELALAARLPVPIVLAAVALSAAAVGSIGARISIGD